LTEHDNAWKMLGITQEVLNAAQDVAATVRGRYVEGWERNVRFLSDLHTKTFFELTSKQENWARGIKRQLETEHGYSFND